MNAGFASPDSALETWLWAYSRGNKEVMLQALIPEAQKDWEKILGGKTADQIRAEASQAFEKTQAYSIVKREVRSDEEIVLHLTRNGNTKVEKMVFKRIGKDWRLAGRDEPNGHKPKVTP